MDRKRFFGVLVLSLFISASLIAGGSLKVVDRFTPGDDGKFPSGWRAVKNKQKKKAKDVYKVVVEGGNAFLCAHSKGDSVTIGKRFKVNLKKYPVLRWRWKVEKLPQGADERFKDTGDSAAGIYVYFPSGIRKWNPKAIKYVWSATELPRGFSTPSPYASRTKIVILENKHSPLGEWIEEEVDVRTDYERFFGKKLKKVEGVGMLTDSDNTKSEAKACYDDIVFTRGFGK